MRWLDANWKDDDSQEGDHMVSDWGPVSDLVSGWGVCPIWLGPVSDSENLK